jgi:hypothetical protein
MKKTIILSIALVCVALGTSLLINSKANKHIHSLAFNNIEALTSDEDADLYDHVDCTTITIHDDETGTYTKLQVLKCEGKDTPLIPCECK